jgi:[protein-PII] uridylyltransferase
LLGLPADSAQPGEEEAFRVLLSIRNALHASARRANDRFLVDLREPAAAWLDMDVVDVAAMMTSALATGDRLADRRWPDIHVETDPMVRFGRRIFHSVRTRFTPEEVPEIGHGVLPMAVAAAGRPDGARFTADEEDTIRAAPVTWTAVDRYAFVQLLTAGSRGVSIFGQLDDLGWLDRAMPEWRAVATAPQLAPFHAHPVGAHLHRAVAEMLTLIDDRGDIGDVVAEVGATEELVLSAFLHDIGKARGGNHSVIGAELTATLMHRAGFGPATVGVVTDAVRLHLLLPETATRRDIADPAVLDEVAVLIGSAHHLRVLYLLAIADLRATGTSVWNPWRASLLRTLYGRVLAAIEGDGAIPATLDVRAVVEAADGSVGRRAIEEHVAAMPDGYLDTTSAADVLWHLQAAQALEGRPALVSVDPDQPGRVLIVGNDRMGFILAVSRALAANGVGVLDARLRTRGDGVALDTFHVVDDRTGDDVAGDRWRTVERDLLATLNGDHDLRPRLRERIEAYRRPQPGVGVAVKVGIDGRFAAIEVRMPDGVGAFTTIVEALHTEGLDVHLARIDTMGPEARDVFFVRRIGGGALRTEPELRALEKRILDRLRS